MIQKLKNIWSEWKWHLIVIFLAIFVVVIPNILWANSLVEIVIQSLPSWAQDVINFSLIGVFVIGLIYVAYLIGNAIKNQLNDWLNK